MDGTLVYWLGWFVWVIGTFFLQKSQQRILLCMCVLALLAFLPWVISFGTWSISLGYVFSLSVGYLFLRTFSFKQLLHTWFVTMCIAGAYIGIFVLIQNDPVLLLIDFPYIVMCCMLIVAFLLAKKTTIRLCSIAIGMLHGEAVQAYIIGQQGYMYTVGSLAFFDIWAMSLVSGASLSFVFFLIEVLKQRVQRTTNPSVKRIDKHASV
ncbi:YphA family membrane protein [Shouchella lonarensis]|uniref:Uncharacterized protein n=1 Tax=Shouchella lonarensis TaxID=1464122 RepID=A0A1G6J0L7_9BACI|nr:hypothetical protein [Shouchella lonarensis]SDC12334.1 hypothetical protein SAMN05421737_105220 [Shouchella lonarensis]